MGDLFKRFMRGDAALVVHVVHVPCTFMPFSSKVKKGVLVTFLLDGAIRSMEMAHGQWSRHIEVRCEVRGKRRKRTPKNGA